MKAELRREIGDRLLQRAAVAGFAVGIRARKIFAKGFVNLLQLAEEIIVLRHFHQPRLARKLEHAHGIVIGPVPQLRDRDGERGAARPVPKSTTN